MRTLWILLTAGFLCASPALGAQRTLRVCDDVIAPASLDPLKEFSEKNHTIIQQIFDGLVRFDPEGRVQPALAKSWRWLDDRTLEFTLRKGVTFHNGEPFTAESVRFSITKFIDPASGFPGAGFLDSISGAVVVDTHTVAIETKYPDGILLHRLAGLVTMIPPKYYQVNGGDYFGKHPVGTGAFRFVEQEPESKRIELHANTDYFAGPVKLDRLEFHFIPLNEQVQALLNGDIDLVTELSGTETTNVMKSGIAKVVKKESFYTAASSLNTKTGPLSDKRVRQALNYAVNKEDLVRYDLFGNGKITATLAMQGELGKNPALLPYPFDLMKAKKLLKEAGHEKGFHLKVLAKVQGLRTIAIISKQLDKVGIILDISPTTDDNAVHDMAKESWDWIFAGCPDPMAHSFFIQSIFLSSLSPFSVTGDAAYDQKLAAMVQAIDSKKQNELAMELDQYTFEEALSLFTYQRIKTYGVKKGIHFVPSVTGMPYFNLSRVDIDAEISR